VRAIRHSLTGMTGEPSFRVVIAGGGVAGLEGALALAELAADRVAITIVAPNAEFVYRPMSVGAPFAFASPQRHPVARLAADVGADLLAESFGWVDPAARTAHTDEGTALPYDALLLALGARARAPFAHAVTIDDRRMDEVLYGIVQDIEGGYVHSIAFVSPARMGWPLPIYELALLTARRAFEMDVELRVTVVTPEATPLWVFGAEASAGVAALLAEAGVEVITASSWSTGWSRCRSSTAPPCAAFRPASTASSRSIPIARSSAFHASTRPATPPTTRSSRAGSRRSRPTPPPRRSRRSPAPRSSR
jgi:hypothetical protein